MSDLQIKSFLLAKTFFNSPVTVSPHKTLNSCRRVISEPDLLSTPDAEILEGFSDQGVIQVRRITIKRDSNIIPKKHIILTFNKPKLPTAVKAGYLHFLWQTRTEWNEVVSDVFHFWYDDTTDYSPGKTGTWSGGFELLRIFGLVRWGLGGSDHVEGTGEKLSFASQAAR
ncbi:RNA-directed DNA polymerase from mobile element jockey [Trichonephila clavipes]|nr:RNA-directed DNA polymerase from mobile element jockey [Trichonephila clavipes]